MRKLQFNANDQYRSDLSASHHCHPTQQYVIELLSAQLRQYGFQTLSQSGEHIAISVDDHALPLSITCQSDDEAKSVQCQISSYPEENQDWVDRIAEQSLLNQLAQAVENTLKQDACFSAFEWKD